MKTLLLINTVINSGSTGRIAEEIGQAALAHGWRSVIAFGRNDRPSMSEKIQVGSSWDIKIHGLQTRFFDRHGLGSGQATERLIEQIEQIKPDIIHLHNIHGYYLNIEVLFNYINARNIPIVWTLHDCWSMTGHCTHFTVVGCERWKTECYACPQKKDYPGSLVLDRSRKNYILKKMLFTQPKEMVMVPVSQWLGDLLRESFLKEHPQQMIHNGVDISVFKPMCSDQVRDKYKIGNRFMLIGVASIWTSRKGLADFIALSEKLTIDDVIVLVGLSLAQIEQLPKNIIGIPRTESVQELAELYSAADIFINPTWEDNFPTTNLEALACGTPIVTYNTGGSIEAVSPETGFVIPQGDFVALQSTINTVKIKGKAQYTHSCRLRAEQHYNKNDRYAEYIALYEQLIKK